MSTPTVSQILNAFKPRNIINIKTKSRRVSMPLIKSHTSGVTNSNDSDWISSAHIRTDLILAIHIITKMEAINAFTITIRGAVCKLKCDKYVATLAIKKGRMIDYIRVSFWSID